MSYHGTLSFDAPLRQSLTDRVWALLALLARQGHLLLTAWRGRRAVTAIADMSPEQLRDIGLIPGDLRPLRHLPCSADPTVILARVVADRARVKHRD